MPVFGKGKLAGQPLLDVQGLGISSNAEDPKAAAAFLEFLNSPEQLKAFWDATGWIPSNTTFDTSVITDATVRSMWENWGLKANISNVTNVMPGQFYERAAIPTGQQIVQGSLTGEQAGELAAQHRQGMARLQPGSGRELPQMGRRPFGGVTSQAGAPQQALRLYFRSSRCLDGGSA